MLHRPKDESKMNFSNELWKVNYEQTPKENWCNSVGVRRDGLKGREGGSWSGSDGTKKKIIVEILGSVGRTFGKPRDLLGLYSITNTDKNPVPKDDRC